MDTVASVVHEECRGPGCVFRQTAQTCRWQMQHAWLLAVSCRGTTGWGANACKAHPFILSTSANMPARMMPIKQFNSSRISHALSINTQNGHSSISDTTQRITHSYPWHSLQGQPNVPNTHSATLSKSHTAQDSLPHKESARAGTKSLFFLFSFSLLLGCLSEPALRCYGDVEGLLLRQSCQIARL